MPRNLAPAAAWAEVLKLVADKPSMSWVSALRIQGLTAGVARLAPGPGQRDLLKFITQPRREQLARLFEGVVGTPVKIDLEIAPPPTDAASPAAGGGPPSALQQAMALPLVKQVMEVFDAQIIEVRPERAAQNESSPHEDPAAPAIPLVPPPVPDDDLSEE